MNKIEYKKLEKDNYSTYYRLNLKWYELEKILEIINKVELNEADQETIKEIIGNIKKINKTKKINATHKANIKKIEESKKKINNAINILKMENKKITIASIAKTANISYNTAKKYLGYFEEYIKYIN